LDSPEHLPFVGDRDSRSQPSGEADAFGQAPARGDDADTALGLARGRRDAHGHRSIEHCSPNLWIPLDFRQHSRRQSDHFFRCIDREQNGQLRGRNDQEIRHLDHSDAFCRETLLC
jgi:hypothetical protein